MSTVQKFLPYDVSSDANFDLIGAGIYDAIITTMGWIEKADTGRTDWSTNPARPSAGSYLWNVFGPNDALQTGATVYYLKVEVGLNSGSQLALRFSLGTSTNGSGTLTGTLSVVIDLPKTGLGNNGDTGLECDFSGDVDRLGMLLWRSGDRAQVAFVERTLSTDGTPSSDGVTIAVYRYQLTSQLYAQQTLVFGVGAGPIAYAPIAMADGLEENTIYSKSSNAWNNSVAISPVFPVYGKFGNPMTVCASLRSADCAEGAIFQTTLYGATRYYLASGEGRLVTFSALLVGNSKMAMRWD